MIKYNELKQASEIEKKDLIAKALKLTEEMGESSSEILKFKGLKGTKLSKQQIKKNITQESGDCLYILYCILTELEIPLSDLEEALNKKILLRLKELKKRV